MRFGRQRLPWPCPSRLRWRCWELAWPALRRRARSGEKRRLAERRASNNGQWALRRAEHDLIGPERRPQRGQRRPIILQTLPQQGQTRQEAGRGQVLGRGDRPVMRGVEHVAPMEPVNVAPPRAAKARNPETGQKVSRATPESQWRRVDVPECRIITEALWDTVQECRKKAG